MQKALLTMALAGMIAIPVAAQFRPGLAGGRGNVLANKSVQAELKLTDSQKKEVGEIQKAQQAAMREAFGLFREDKEKAQEQMKKATETTKEAYKKLREGLKSEQQKRLGEIEIQVAVKDKRLDLFRNEDVLKILKLSDTQKENLKETGVAFMKDAKELFDDAKGNFRKMAETQKKVKGLSNEAFDKVMKGLDTDQKKALEKAQGESFDYKPDEFPTGPFRRDKGKRKPKEDA